MRDGSPSDEVGSFRDGSDAGWVAARFVLVGDLLEIHSPVRAGDSMVRRIRLDDVDGVDELVPFDHDPPTIEIRLASGEVIHASMSRGLVTGLCSSLAATLIGADGSSGPVASVRPPRAAGGRSPRWWAAVAAAAVLVVIGTAAWYPGNVDTAASAPSSTSTSTSTSTTTEPPTTTVPDTTTTTPPTTTTAPPTTIPVPMAIAPLTGLPAPEADLQRPAIVSKIDASLSAMPQVGLQLADVIYEVRIEFGSRYLAVWHSREPEVVGPHRSARTTDPDLLAMFGHPLFAFSGANDGVVRTLAMTPWKTGVGPGEVGRAYFRDEQRPWPHNLFARTAVLRTRPSPPQWPTPLFHFHDPATPPPGIPVEGFTSAPGVHVDFRWDPDLDGWRRRIWDQEHVHADGTPVAPTNVVVLETGYRVSHVDVRSPEAVSVGTGRAWAFTDGQVREGTWTRWSRTDPWNIVDSTGWPLTLEPGSTWVVLAEGRPVLWPPG